MPPTQFHIRLQRGIVGGFAPPTPTAVHQLTRDDNEPDGLVIVSMVRSDGEPEFTPQPQKRVSLRDAEALVDELHGILKSLPTPYPPDSEDIYGLDTSIFWGSDDLEWNNGAPQGVSGGSSDVQANDEEKAQFQRAVEIIEELVKK